MLLYLSINKKYKECLKVPQLLEKKTGTKVSDIYVQHSFIKFEYKMACTMFYLKKYDAVYDKIRLLIDDSRLEKGTVNRLKIITLYLICHYELKYLYLDLEIRKMKRILKKFSVTKNTMYSDMAMDMLKKLQGKRYIGRHKEVLEMYRDKYQSLAGNNTKANFEYFDILDWIDEKIKQLEEK